jgi:NADP-dependent 3-hydroxy acid dehydrogenase YdfG
MTNSRKIAVVTGASSGIGAAASRQLAEAGFDVILGARRLDRIEAIAKEIGGRAIQLDVTSQESVNNFCSQVENVNILVNNAGGALGLATVAEADTELWRKMYDTNVLGLMRMTRALLPKLISSNSGHIVNITSVAGIEAYPNGGGYTAAKHAARVVTQTLRQELIGKPVRVTDIAPGLVETEFSIVRFDGDKQRADKVYEGMTPLVADDIADAIVWAVTRKPHVNIDFMVIKPLDQVSATIVNRKN